jgi:hypothetical protein
MTQKVLRLLTGPAERHPPTITFALQFGWPDPPISAHKPERLAQGEVSVVDWDRHR